MPVMFDQQVYLQPGGFPVLPENINVDGVNVQARFLRLVAAETENKQPLEDDKQIIADFLRYFMQAPCWDIREEHLERLEGMTYQELFSMAYGYGLDPF